MPCRSLIRSASVGREVSPVEVCRLWSPGRLLLPSLRGVRVNSGRVVRGVRQHCPKGAKSRKIYIFVAYLWRGARIYSFNTLILSYIYLCFHILYWKVKIFYSSFRGLPGSFSFPFRGDCSVHLCLPFRPLPSCGISVLSLPRGPSHRRRVLFGSGWLCLSPCIIGEGSAVGGVGVFVRVCA